MKEGPPAGGGGNLHAGGGPHSETARAWHAGCAEWVRIHDLPALKEMFAVRKEEEERRNVEEDVPEDEAAQDAAAGPTNADSLPEEEETAVEEGTPLVVPYPYVRFLGRMADVMMHMTLYLAVLRIFGLAFSPDFLPGSYEALLYLCLPMVLIETAFLGTLGTTPGKPCWASPSGTTGEAPFLLHGVPALPVRHGAGAGLLCPS